MHAKKRNSRWKLKIPTAVIVIGRVEWQEMHKMFLHVIHKQWRNCKDSNEFAVWGAKTHFLESSFKKECLLETGHFTGRRAISFLHKYLRLYKQAVDQHNLRNYFKNIKNVIYSFRDWSDCHLQSISFPQGLSSSHPQKSLVSLSLQGMGIVRRDPENNTVSISLFLI